MPKLLSCAALAAGLLLASGCQKNGTSPTAPGAACALAAKTVKTITDAAGIVRYDATLRQYTVAVAQPGTYDSVDVGVVCGTLLVALQQAGARVTVSGTFKEYGQPAPSSVVAGTTYYYLEVSSIQPR